MMAETMLTIFQRHRDCFDFTKEPDWQESIEARQICEERQRERENAVKEYLNGVLAANDFWADDINEDANELALSFQRITNKAEREAYKEAVDEFLCYVGSELRRHRLERLNPLTRFRMGRREAAMNVIDGLSRDEAGKEAQRMKKQGFAFVCVFPTDAFPAVYTVLGYRPRGGEQPTGARNNAHSGTNAAGRGNDASTPDKTPTGAQEARKKPKKQGRPPKEFDEYFNEPGEAEPFIPILAKMLKGKKAKDAARIIIAFYEGGWTIERPSLLSIERKFRLKHSSDISDRIRCHYNHKKMQAPEYKPFPPEELNPIIVAIKREIAKQQPPQNAEK